MNRYSSVKDVCFGLVFLLTLLVVTAVQAAERPFPKPKGPVNDFANVIPSAYEQKMTGITTELYRKTGTAVVIVTMPDIGGAEYNDYATRLYSAWGIGKKGEDKGVLIFVTVKEHRDRVWRGRHFARRPGGRDPRQLYCTLSKAE